MKLQRIMLTGVCHCGGNQFAVVFRQPGEPAFPFDPEHDGLNPCIRCYLENCVECARQGMRNAVSVRVPQRPSESGLGPTDGPTRNRNSAVSREICC